MTRRFRPTFLLQLVSLLASLGLFGVVFLAATSVPLRIGTLGVLIVFWFVAIEMGLLPEWMERVAIRRAARKDVAASSRWFVDADAERRRYVERLRTATRDNPALH